MEFLFLNRDVDMILLVEPMAEAGSHVVGATGDATVTIAHRFIDSIIGFTWRRRSKGFIFKVVPRIKTYKTHPRHTVQVALCTLLHYNSPN